MNEQVLSTESFPLMTFYPDWDYVGKGITAWGPPVHDTTFMNDFSKLYMTHTVPYLSFPAPSTSPTF